MILRFLRIRLTMMLNILFLTDNYNIESYQDQSLESILFSILPRPHAMGGLHAFSTASLSVLLGIIVESCIQVKSESGYMVGFLL